MKWKRPIDSKESILSLRQFITASIEAEQKNPKLARGESADLEWSDNDGEDHIFTVVSDYDGGFFLDNGFTNYVVEDIEKALDECLPIPKREEKKCILKRVYYDEDSEGVLMPYLTLYSLAAWEFEANSFRSNKNPVMHNPCDVWAYFPS